MPLPPFVSWASGFPLEIEWFWAKIGMKFEWRPLFFCSSPNFGQKMGRNLSEDFLFLLFTWFWAKNGTKFECDYFKFWSMFLSYFLKFLPPPSFQNPAYATDEKLLVLHGSRLKKVIWVGGISSRCFFNSDNLIKKRYLKCVNKEKCFKV